MDSEHSEPIDHAQAYAVAQAALNAAPAHKRALARWRAGIYKEANRAIVNTWLAGATTGAMPTVRLPVPEKIMLWQGKAMLAMTGKLEAVEAKVMAHPDPRVPRFWHNGNELYQNVQLLDDIAEDTSINVSSDEIDEMFRQAPGVAF